MQLLPIIASLTLFLAPALAQFQFFDQMFGGHGQQRHQAPQNAPSDSDRYRQNYENTYCDNYLCPHTLACVHFPHHCPCPFPDVEDKVELADGSMVCVSKGGWEVGEAARKIELARKGLL